ncbi:MAG: hypothetical protein ACI9M6_001585 [Hydrogenophaga sp.]|jgi:hypothetical protein
MTNTQLRTGLRAALLSFALCAAAVAQAADGFIVNAAQQDAVKVGMTRAQVMSLLGRPAHNVKYMTEPGRSWTYGVVGSASKNKVFDVDFSKAGLVIEKSERVEMIN